MLGFVLEGHVYVYHILFGHMAVDQETQWFVCHYSCDERVRRGALLLESALQCHKSIY